MKNLGKILATIGLGFGLLSGCASSVKPETKEDEILKEKEKYGMMTLITSGDESMLQWDIDKDRTNELAGEYHVLQLMPNLFYLELIKCGEDKNKNGIFDKDEITNENKEIQNFVLEAYSKGVILYRDKEGDTNQFKAFYYKPLGLDKYKGLYRFFLKLEAIQEDTNKNGKLDDYEFLWKEEDFDIDSATNKNETNKIDLNGSNSGQEIQL